MRTILLPARLALLPVRLLLLPLRRRRGDASVDDLADAIDELADLDASLDELDAEEVVEAVVEELAGRSRRSKAARGFLMLVVLGAAVCVVLYLLRQRRDFEYARLQPEPERPDLTPTDPISPLDSSDGPSADDGPAVDPNDGVSEDVEQRTAAPVAG